MTWRSSTTPQDRLFACLPYLLPLLIAVSFSGPFFGQFPDLQVILTPLVPLMAIYSFPFAGLLIFFALLFLVVRNERISHFIRFNAMQAILLDIILVLCNIVLDLVLRPALGGGLLIDTLYNVIFLGAIVAIGYSIVQSVLGRYADIPTLSDAVYMQVPR